MGSTVMSSVGWYYTYPSGEGRLFAEDVIVNIEGAAGTMIVSV